MKNFLCCYSYYAYFIFFRKKIEKCVRERKKTETLKLIYWLRNLVLDIHWLNHWLWLVPDGSYAWLLNFLSSGEGFVFLWKNVLPKLSKLTDLPNVSIREKVGGNIDLPKVIKMDINFELLKVSKMTSFKIFISPVMEKLEHQIWTAGKHHWKSFTGYLPQEVVISLAYNHLTNLFISSYRGATVIKFEQ